MKQLIVTLYVRSRLLDPDQITFLMGVSPNDSHRRGDVTARSNACYLDHFWWLDSGAGDQATMEAHGTSLMSKLSCLAPEVLDLVSAGNIDISIGVGIMSDTYTTSILLPRGLVAFASRIGASFEVSVYPTDFS